MADWTTEFFGAQLLTKEGLKSTKEVLANKSRIGIYFSAHWVCVLMKTFFLFKFSNFSY